MARHAAKRKPSQVLRSWLPPILAVALFAVVILLVMQACDRQPPKNDGNSTTTTVTTVTNTTTTASTTVTTTTVTTTVNTTTAPTTAATTTAKPTTAPTVAVEVPNTAGHYVQKSAPSWELRLVNPWNPLPANYDYTGNLAQYATGKEFDSRAIESLRKMVADGKEHGLYAASLFRPYDLQVKLYNRQVDREMKNGLSRAEAEVKAATVVARPGTSEHHMGLAVDILGSGYSSLVESFDKTSAFAWLKAHCAEYGFILRYPKEKEPITGVIYEPWHYRYVGIGPATEIMRRGITLEEYLEEKDGSV